MYLLSVLIWNTMFKIRGSSCFLRSRQGLYSLSNWNIAIPNKLLCRSVLLPRICWMVEKMCSSSTIRKALDAMTVSKQHFLCIIHFVVIFIFVFVCMTFWFSSHYVVPTYKYIFLEFSKRWSENVTYREDIFYLISLFSLLYNLIFVASVLSTQPRRKRKYWLSKYNDNVSMLSDMSTTSQACCWSVLVMYQSSSSWFSSKKWKSLSFHGMTM